MKNKKQTAVEWLMENLHTAKDPFTQAKAMEKEQRAELIVKMKSDQKVITYFKRLISKSIRNSKK